MAAPTSSTCTWTFHVPLAGADDGHRVAERRQRAPQRVDGRSGAVEQVLHLVSRTVGARSTRRAGVAGGTAAGAGARSGSGPSAR